MSSDFAGCTLIVTNIPCVCVCRAPSVSTDAFVAPNATVIGSVSLSTRASVLYGAVVRGDLNDVSIGAYSTVGDRAVIHTTKSVEGHVSAGVRVGSHVMIGPGALLQSCTVEDGAVIGAGAIVLEGALVESNAIVGEGAVVHPGRRIPSGQVWAGNPAVYVRDASKTELAEMEGHAEEAADVASEHAHAFLPYTTAYQQAEKLGVQDAVRVMKQTVDGWVLCVLLYLTSHCQFEPTRDESQGRGRCAHASKSMHVPASHLTVCMRVCMCVCRASRPSMPLKRHMRAVPVAMVPAQARYK